MKKVIEKGNGYFFALPVHQDSDKGQNQKFFQGNLCTSGKISNEIWMKEWNCVFLEIQLIGASKLFAPFGVSSRTICSSISIFRKGLKNLGHRETRIVNITHPEQRSITYIQFWKFQQIYEILTSAFQENRKLVLNFSQITQKEFICPDYVKFFEKKAQIPKTLYSVEKPCLLLYEKKTGMCYRVSKNMYKLWPGVGFKQAISGSPTTMTLNTCIIRASN